MPTLSALLDRLQIMQEEVGCDGEKTAAHTYPSSVRFRIDGDDADMDIEIELESVDDIEPESHMGCGCWTGVVFVLKRKK